LLGRQDNGGLTARGAALLLGVVLRDFRRIHRACLSLARSRLTRATDAKSHGFRILCFRGGARAHTRNFGRRVTAPLARRGCRSGGDRLLADRASRRPPPPPCLALRNPLRHLAAYRDSARLSRGPRGPPRSNTIGFWGQEPEFCSGVRPPLPIPQASEAVRACQAGLAIRLQIESSYGAFNATHVADIAIYAKYAPVAKSGDWSGGKRFAGLGRISFSGAVSPCRNCHYGARCGGAGDRASRPAV
jgi:hypothetical protein